MAVPSSSFYVEEAKQHRRKTFKRQEYFGRSIVMNKKSRSISYEETLIEDFRNNPEEAFLYLRSCMEDNDPQLFLLAIRQVSKALGGIAKIAEHTGLNREHLYRTFSKAGNPTWSSVNAVVNSLGMQFTLKPLTS